MINKTIPLPSSISSILKNEEIFFYPQIGSPYRIYDFHNCCLVDEKNMIFIVFAGQEHHYDLEPRKHLILVSNRFITQFYVFFERFSVGSRIDDNFKNIEWHVGIQKVHVFDGDYSINDASLLAKKEISKAALELKDLTGFDLNKILGVSVFFRTE